MKQASLSRRPSFIPTGDRLFYPNLEGFTLVEVLVSVAVLALIILLVAQLTNSATSVSTASRKRLDADSHARMIFDRMAIDFANMIKRSDADCVFAKLASGTNKGMNDSVFFYSSAPAYFNSSVGSNKSPMALIGYRINFNNPDYPNTPVLERLGKGLTWDGPTTPSTPGGMAFLTTFPGSATPTFASTIAGDGTVTNPGIWNAYVPNSGLPTIGTLAGTNGCAYGDGNDADYHVISNQVYRLEIAFQLDDSSLSAYPLLFTKPSWWTSGTFYTQSDVDPTSAAGIPTYNVGSRWYNTTTKQGYICTNSATNAAVWERIGVQDVSAIVVAIALLDPTSRKIVPTSYYPAMVSELPDAETYLYVGISKPLLMAQTWNYAITNASTGIPQTAASQLRIYQRYFYVK
jgi:prepilin-type N-terminal cleavage/methylation domain-containing protein